MYNDWDNAHVGMFILRRFKVIMSNHGHPEYRKIPKISPEAYIFQRPFLRGLYSEGLIYGGKFAFQNRLG